MAKLIAAAVILKVLTPTVMAAFGGNHCDVPDENWSNPVWVTTSKELADEELADEELEDEELADEELEDERPACLDFTADGSNGYQTSPMEICGEGEEEYVEYAYRKITMASLRTFIVVTDMRNAVSNVNDATLYVAFR